MRQRRLGLLGSAALVTLLLSCGTGQAANFTLSDAFGAGNFGSVTATDLGAQPGSTDTVQVKIDMSPNWVIDTGSHFAVTLSLVGTGRIDQASVTPDQGTLTVQTHQTLAANFYSNSPFGDFSDALAGGCGTGSSSGGCGSKVTFNVINFQGFAQATNLYDPPPAGGQTFAIFMAVDIAQRLCDAAGVCTTGDTGAVGLTGGIPVQQSAPPVPLPGAVWLLGTVLLGLFGASRTKLGEPPKWLTKEAA